MDVVIWSKYYFPIILLMTLMIQYTCSLNYACFFLLFVFFCVCICYYLHPIGFRTDSPLSFYYENLQRPSKKVFKLTTCYTVLNYSDCCLLWHTISIGYIMRRLVCDLHYLRTESRKPEIM